MDKPRKTGGFYNAFIKQFIHNQGGDAKKFFDASKIFCESERGEYQELMNFVSVKISFFHDSLFDI